ncbi:NAD(P)-dependent oxidoreductase [Rhodococcus pseudokoreensis]|uniref:NAD(P)-dependent oxidoreductase n=1 Tax=Rhodococcus pseudokoreensis TaxID=2811421 RepID=A0A974ZU21_9NOCA|nr:NAD(P)-dependent oxidoreductase [Rhodococcus pseudokoreensis]QSE89802.1 NAD(P)-dependent oxidoreductase [Rhodococcus pseudokoreensis]
MTVIGFIGPGVMGRPMAANLVAAGHDVRVYGHSDRSRARAESTGGTVVDSIRDACAGADVVFTMLPDGPAVLEAVTGEDGVVASMTPGTVLVDHSTIAPAESLAVHAAAAEADLRCLDAPVSGGEAGAVEGALSIMVGGDQETLDEVRSLLEVMGATVVHVGDPGSGQVVKAANQLMVAGHLQMLAEALVFLRAHGADLPNALDVLGGGLAGSTVLERKRAAMLTGDFTPGFRIALHDKDLGIVSEAVRGRGLVLPATGLMSSLVASVKARGGAGLDHAALYGLALELNGLKITD